MRQSRQYRLLIAEALALAAAGVTIAVLAGADVSGAVATLAWGAVVFGGAMAALIWLLALIFLAVARGRADKPPRDARRGRLDKFFDGLFGSWRGVLFFLAVLGFAAVEDAESAAFIAGYPLGTALITTPAAALLRRVQSRVHRP
jgi:hypothetical protein